MKVKGVYFLMQSAHAPWGCSRNRLTFYLIIERDQHATRMRLECYSTATRMHFGRDSNAVRARFDRYSSAVRRDLRRDLSAIRARAGRASQGLLLPRRLPPPAGGDGRGGSHVRAGGDVERLHFPAGGAAAVGAPPACPPLRPGGSEPGTRNPEPGTRNPEPRTRKPETGT